LQSYYWPGNIRQLRNLAEQLSVVELDKEISAETLMGYLPDAGRGGLPTLYRGQEKQSKSDFANEREILYQILFDMRKDIADLKKLTGDLMQNASMSEEWKDQGESLLNRIGSETNLPARVERGVELPERNYAPIYDDGSAQIHTESYDPAEPVEDEPITLQEKELEMIKSALDRNQHKRKDAAKELGISERTLYRKIKQYNL
jgi:transcriptional regulator with PAS, ATPase and Fis domain